MEVEIAGLLLNRMNATVYSDAAGTPLSDVDLWD